MPTVFFAQSDFSKFEDREDVTTVIVTQKMFKMISSTKSKESQQYINLVKKLENLRVFTTESAKTAAEMKSAADKHIKSAGLEELMRVNDKGQNIKIMVKTGSTETKVKELLMFIEGSGKGAETVLMSLVGEFDLNDISMLTEKMNLPGGNELKKAGKGAKGSK
jgi:hypothetical protein